MTSKELYERDYRDICYFIKHVKNTKLRIDILKKMGYKIGVDVATSNSALRNVVIGKRKEKRIQITAKTPLSPLVACVILEDSI